MSTINCDACNELREYAPEFVQNGVTNRVSTSLKNDTGFNPSLTVAHKDCEDLNDANDCLIGRMGQELEAYEVCDWKEYMAKFMPNLYELLKADIAADCGQWTNIHNLWSRTDRLCTSVDGLFGIIGGSGAKDHKFTPTELFREKFWAWLNKDDGSGERDDITEYYFPTFQAEIRQGYGCNVSRRLQTWRIQLGLFGGTIWPRTAGAGCKDLEIGDVLGYINKSDLVPNDLTERTWQSLMRGANAYNAFSIALTHRVFCRLRGYIEIDGYVYNEDLKDTYGPDVMIMQIHSIEDDVTGGGIWGTIMPLDIHWV